MACSAQLDAESARTGAEGGAAGGGWSYAGRQGIDNQQLEQLSTQYGFDKPWHQRYLQLLGNYLRFDLGDSYFRNDSVWHLIQSKLAVSVSLGVWVFFLTYLISVPLGVAKVVRAGWNVVSSYGPHTAANFGLDVARPIQGHPVIVQAGNSDTGREFAARIAEMTYCSAQSLDVAQTYYADVKGRMAKYGRAPDQLKITPGLSVVVAPSEQEARDKFAELQDAVDFSHGMNLMGQELTGYDIDGPLPDLPESESRKGRFHQLVELARKENLTIRQLVLRFNVSKGHIQVVGSPKQVADTIEEWFMARGADGFNVVPPLLPGGFEDFVELVPELQRRGLFRTEYEGKTYRESLGLVRPGDRKGV